MLGRVQSVNEIRRLRRRGLRIAWSAQLGGGANYLRHGRGCTIGPGSMVIVGEDGPLTLGEGVVLGDYSNVRAGTGPITIGSRVLFAQFVSLISANHIIDERGVPSWAHVDMDRRGITIGDDCWLAVQAVVLPGVSLGERCVVGAGAVVTKSFPAGSRLVGVPARAV